MFESTSWYCKRGGISSRNSIECGNIKILYSRYVHSFQLLNHLDLLPILEDLHKVKPSLNVCLITGKTLTVTHMNSEAK